MPPPSNFITRITTHPAWLALSADIFTGQIIASLIVLTFVAVFLLREWIAQNARPGVFEEEEVLPPADPAPVQPPEPQPQPQRRAIDADDFPEPDVLVQHQADAMQAVNAIQAVNAVQRQNVDPDVALNPDRWFQDDEEGPRRNIKKQKARKVDDNDGEGWQTDQRRKSHDNHVQEVEDFRRKQFHRRIHVAKAVGAHRRNFYRPQKPHFPPPLQRNVPVAAEGQQKFDFTFKPDQNGESSSKLQVPSSSHTSGPPPSSDMPFTFNSANDTSPFPTVALQPPSSDIPFSLRSLQPESSISPQSYPVRPSLPTYTLGGSLSGSESPFPSPAKTPVETPSLATYRAPEELGPIAGPSSSPPDYFELEQIEQQVEDEAVYGGHPNDDDDDDDEWDNVDSDENVDLEAEHDKYFREHGDVDIEVERERYLREVARDEDREVPQERVRIQLAVESESEDESDEGEGEEEIHDDGDHEDEEDNLRDEEEDDGQWQEEDEDAQVIADGQAGQDAQVAGEPGPANGLDEENLGANLDPNDMAENVEDDMDGAMEGVCRFSQDRLLTNTTLLAIGMRGPVYAVFQNVCSILSS